MSIKVLELFAGTQSVGKVAKELGMEVFSTDIMPEFNTDYTCDILEFDYEKVTFKPDIIHASPPCQSFSVMQIGRNWNHDNTPKTDAARLGMAIVLKTVEIINYFKPKYWIIENPVGKLRKLNLIKDGIRRSVTYCQYKDTRMKPTDFWTNCYHWTPRPMCKAGMSCHESAPRGSKTGTQGKDKLDRYIIPHDLCLEFLSAMKIGIENNYPENYKKDTFF